MTESASSLVELRLLGLQVIVRDEIIGENPFGEGFDDDDAPPDEIRRRRRQDHLLLLREATGDGRVLPVMIDVPEAEAIYRGIEGIEPPRPLTHELLHQILEELGVSVERVTITEITNRTFFAELEVRQNGALHIISARPSDAVAVAVRHDAPIFARRSVMDEAGQLVELPPLAAEDEDPEELLDEFKQFLSEVSAADFGSQAKTDEAKPDEAEPGEARADEAATDVSTAASEDPSSGSSDNSDGEPNRSDQTDQPEKPEGKS